MLAHNKILSAMDAFELYQQGMIILGRTFVKDYRNNKYRVIRFEQVKGHLVMWIELPSGDTFATGMRELRDLKLEVVPEVGLTRTEQWMDPA